MALIDLAGLRRFFDGLKTLLDGKASADLSNVSNAAFAQKMREADVDAIYTAESTDGIAYTVTVPGVTELVHGMRIVISPSRNSASTAITLDVNGLGAKYVRLPLSFNNVAASMPRLATFYSAGKPLLLMYDATYAQGQWKAVEKPRVSAQDLYGTTPIESGGTGGTTAADALENLGAASKAYVDDQIAALRALIEGQ